MESATTWTPSQSYGIADVDKQAHDRKYHVKVVTFP